ncbi:MAG: class I SAM-dependent methyltransferase [Chloroflexi bacterium]|nr:class I SAM-dependent methyltransferase [Chloroflexota bacterium]OJV89644.1 MAG: hypothetical protein BGO39_37455 [Chloroflexi bacterium 54-19]
MLKNLFKNRVARLRSVEPVINPVAPEPEVPVAVEAPAVPEEKPEEKQVVFNLDTLYKGHYNVTYRGITYIRCPFDYVLYQMLISEVQPDLIIEIGTNAGGGALYMADLLELNGKGIVHTIDINDSINELAANHKRIKYFTDGWENYDLSLAEGYEKVMVIDDGAHQYRQVLPAFARFSPLVTLGSYYIVEDGIIDELGMSELFEGGPLRAINEFLQDRDDFVIDRRWCDFFGRNATFNVNGYLKRVK